MNKTQQIRPSLPYRFIVFATGLLAFYACGHSYQQGAATLENEKLKIELMPELPMVRTFTYKPSGRQFKGDSGSVGWEVNGHLYPWQEWKIVSEQQQQKRVYHLSLPALKISFDYTLTLDKQALSIGLSQINDPENQLKSISWGDQLLLNVSDTSMRWWARQSSIGKPWEKKKSDNRGLWSYDENTGKVGDSTATLLSTVDACVWKKKEVALALVTNTDLFPVKISGAPGKGFALGLNDWSCRLTGQTMPALSASLVFLDDLNGDGDISAHDYFVWRNRRMTDVPEFIRDAIAYKVFMDEPTAKEPVTTLAQLDKIVTAIHNITDGLPQIAYLVGWQDRGHDTEYPSFEKWNERLGPHKDIYGLANRYRDQLNTLLSYHINIDDAYRPNKGFDPAIMATDYDGGPMFWQSFHGDTAFHLSHYKDRQSGAIFKRFDSLFLTVPVKQILHIDAMRTINCNPVWEKDSLGVAEELELGLKPIMHWLQDRGISVTTEGQNGMPHELTGLVAGVYHLDEPSEANLMIRHRKLVGGGWEEGRGRLECGLGTSLHEDLAYRKVGNNFGFTKDWNILKERIYLGTLLELYYQQRQLVDATRNSDGWVLKFDDGTTTVVDPHHLLVTHGDIVIARDDDRFVPIGKSIYIFSKTGGEKEWTLPEDFRGKPLELFSLTENGHLAAPVTKVSGSTLQIHLKAGVPVKIALKNGQ